MPRNFDRRVEVMFPIEAEEARHRIIEEIIPIYMRDNTRSRILMPEGTYERVAAWQGGEEFRSQRDLLNSAQTNLRRVTRIEKRSGQRSRPPTPVTSSTRAKPRHSIRMGPIMLR